MSVLQAGVCTDVEFFDWLVQVLRFVDIDCHELEDSVLGDDTDHHWSASLIIVINDWYSPCSGMHHPSTCFIQRLEWVN